MKRWLSVLLAALLFVSALPMGVSADGVKNSALTRESVDTVPHFYGAADKTQLSRGDVFDFTVMLEDNSGLISWMVEVDFDTSALVLIDRRQEEAFADGGYFIFSEWTDQSPTSAMWYDFINPNNTAEGGLFTLTFRVREDAPAGEYPIRLYCSDQDNFSDENGNTIAVRFSDAAVTVLSCEHAYEHPCAAVCYLCGETREVEHHWELSSFWEPTCSADGSKQYHCSLCGDAYMEIIPATGQHTYDNDYDGECNVCGTSREVAECPHAYTMEPLVTPTCVDTGMNRYTCALCGNVYTEVVNALGHTYTSVVTAPTCTVGGYTAHTCMMCGDGYTDGETAALGHIYNHGYDADCNVCGETREILPIHIYGTVDKTDVERGDTFILTVMMENNLGLAGWKVDVAFDASALELIAQTRGDTFPRGTFSFSRLAAQSPANALWYNFLTPTDTVDNGVLFTFTFRVKDTAVNGSLPLTLDCFDADNVSNLAGDTIPVTFDSATVNVYGCAHQYDNICDDTCNLCGETRAADGHDYQSVVTAPTCAADGVALYTCAVCGDTYSESIPALGHTYTTVVTAPTCESAGYTTYTCTRCGASYVDTEIAALGHDYRSVVTAPTCINEGYTTHTCTGCGDSYTDSVTPATGEHMYDDSLDPDCNTCGAVRHVGDHVLVGSVITPATCGAAGVIAYGCIYCDYRTISIIPATGNHSYDHECDPDCNACGTVCVLGGHRYDNACDPDCAICGFHRTVAHVYRTPTAPVCALCGTVFWAGNTPIVYGVADNALLTRGDTFTLTVMMDNNPGLAGWIIDVAYDEAVLELVSQTKGDAFTGGSFSFGPLRSPANALWMDFLSGVDMTANGILFRFTFMVKADAAFGTTILQLYCSDADNILNIAWESVSFAFESTAVVVQDHTHAYDNACDADCDMCGFTRTPADHVYDHHCDTDCNECGLVRQVGDHVYDAAVTVSPTCTAAGTKVYTCIYCGDTYIESIPALGHTYTAVVTAPTCESAGYTTHTCTRCGDSYVDTEVAAFGHNYSGAVTTEPTCIAEGVKTYTCANCGDTYTESIPASGHNYESVVTAPTCESAGYTTHTCTRCGDTYVDTEVAALGHNYDHAFDADCNNCGILREIPGVYGDISGDGRVNVRDYALFQQYLNGWDIDVLVLCVDLNADDHVNVRDLGLLQQYLNGWDVTLGR